MRCLLCGGYVREKRGIISCDSCGASEYGDASTPDLFALLEHPEEFTTEADRRRRQQRRSA